MFDEGEVLVPFVLDLESEYEVCGVKYSSSTLRDLFETNVGHATGKSVRKELYTRNKRFIALLALGLGVASAAWGAVTHIQTANAVQQLRNKFDAQLSYVSK